MCACMPSIDIKTDTMSPHKFHSSSYLTEIIVLIKLKMSWQLKLLLQTKLPEIY